MQHNVFPMPVEQIHEWDGRHGSVTFGEPERGALPVWITIEGLIAVHDDHLTVTPRSRNFMKVAPYPQNGRVEFGQVKAIRARV